MARSPDRPSEAFALDFPDYAQEFLRRNPEYCTQFSKMQSKGMGEGPLSSAQQRMAKPWGLVFPVRPLPHGNATASAVER